MILDLLIKFTNESVIYFSYSYSKSTNLQFHNLTCLPKRQHRQAVTQFLKESNIFSSINILNLFMCLNIVIVSKHIMFSREAGHLVCRVSDGCFLHRE